MNIPDSLDEMFSRTFQEPPTDMDIWNDLQQQLDIKIIENTLMKKALKEIVEFEDEKYILHSSVVRFIKDIAVQTLKVVEDKDE